jgi:hypothetical protein
MTLHSICTMTCEIWISMRLHIKVYECYYKITSVSNYKVTSPLKENIKYRARTRKNFGQDLAGMEFIWLGWGMKMGWACILCIHSHTSLVSSDGVCLVICKHHQHGQGDVKMNRCSSCSHPKKQKVFGQDMGWLGMAFLFGLRDEGCLGPSPN